MSQVNYMQQILHRHLLKIEHNKLLTEQDKKVKLSTQKELILKVLLDHHKDIKDYIKSISTIQLT